MTAPCTRCSLDCSGNCLKLADGTQPGASKVRCVVTYQHFHHREKSMETRHAFGRIVSILPDGALWVLTDRDGGMRIEPQAVEVVT